MPRGKATGRMVVPKQAPVERSKKFTKLSPASRLGFGETESDKALISKLLGETIESWRMPPVKDDEELAARLDEFFKQCAEQGKIPTVEELELCTGYSHGYISEVSNGKKKGFSPDTKRIIQRAKNFLKTFDAKLVLTGEMNPIVYFFRAKNYYDMRDQQEVTLNANTQNEKEMSKEDLEKWFLEDGKKVTTNFTDEG